MDKDEVLKLAKLARIDITEAEAGELTKEFQPILKYVGEVKKGVGSREQGVGKNKEEYAVRNVMREDENPHEGDLHTKELLNEAPDKVGRYIKVKKIL
jgi:aspartyl/glutamyl-tRNA(Asn/Gln) amidotransferase C subunit